MTSFPTLTTGVFTRYLCVGFVLLISSAAVPVQAIGPDIYGYTANAITVSFEDISATGTSILAGTEDDAVEIPIGFPFTI